MFMNSSMRFIGYFMRLAAVQVTLCTVCPGSVRIQAGMQYAFERFDEHHFVIDPFVVHDLFDLLAAFADAFMLAVPVIFKPGVASVPTNSFFHARVHHHVRNNTSWFFRYFT